jgi:phosphatidylethanolamine/phosphatidyl-N-methylethanolamine N-methyltransferase
MSQARLTFESRDPDRERMQRAYRMWAPVYDLVCESLFASSRRRVSALASLAGGEVLEIGVGTGLSLPDYDPDMVVTGIDASEEMIAKAREKARLEARATIRSLSVMDALALKLEDARFDTVVAQFLVTLVPNPEAMLDEAWRVLKPGGALLLLNHFRSQNPLLRAIEIRSAPLMHSIGLRPDFPFERIEEWAEQQLDLHTLSRTPSGPLGCFSIVRLEKSRG